MTRILLSGCNGRMGNVISEICKKNPETVIVAGIDLNTERRHNYPVYDNYDAVRDEADVAVDFSNTSLTESMLEFCHKRNLPVVICTTGHTEEQRAKISEYSEKIPVFKSGNMSLGINVLIMLVERAARVLGETFDTEIIERHHNQKIDAPSGTALMIAERLAEALPYQAELVYDRHEVREKRAYNEIGIHTVRGGTIVGEHEVIFAGRDEVIEIKHTASSREVFAAGAVKAAVFMAGVKKPGMYDMNDLVNKYSAGY
jgi:4-hydroxy-tetrahydrodipicolinate reductase